MSSLAKLVHEVITSHQLKITHKLSAEIAEGIQQSILKGLESSGRFRFGTIGSFSVKTRAARTGRNPKTGDALNIPAKKTIKFTPSKKLKDEAQSFPEASKNAEL